MSTEGGFWMGFGREDGSIGIRNRVLVIYTVECAHHVARKIVEGEIDAELVGFSGCYDNAYAIRLLLALARHPNTGAVLCVGLGCEYTQPGKIRDAVRASGRPAEAFFIQDIGGTLESVAHGKAALALLRRQMEEGTKRVPMGLADLVIGAECGGSDATSGMVGNPLVGAFFDRLVDAGGTAI